MFKKSAAIAVCVAMVFSMAGCKWQIKDDAVMRLAVKSAASNLGYFIATEMPDKDGAIRFAYGLIRGGKLPPEEIAEALKELKLKEPILAMNAALVLEAMGAVISEDAVGVAGIPDDF